ncbi:MAG: hypothetical protein P8M53_06540, partial [Pirellulales bacterium]|nr:hypothetical protein [Pirellulales bacterium]
MVSNRHPGSSLQAHSMDALLPQILLRIVDLCLIAILFFAPLFMGGRHPVGRFVFVSITAIMAIAWLVRQCLLQRAVWRSTAGQWLFFAACCLVLFQVFPISSEWMTTLAPSTTDLLSLWSQGEQFGNWSYLSFNPQSTKYGLAILFAYGITFLITVQRVETLADVQMILKWIAFATIGLAILGLIQYLLKGENILWAYDQSLRNK